MPEPAVQLPVELAKVARPARAELAPWCLQGVQEEERKPEERELPEVRVQAERFVAPGLAELRQPSGAPQAGEAARLWVGLASLLQTADLSAVFLSNGLAAECPSVLRC